MTYEEAIEYIHGISWTFCKPGLERIRELCHRLGDPQDSLRFIHVAGTNGKGSFCSMLSSVLIKAGYRVGLYTSPYILEFNERMQFNGMPIENNLLASLTERVKPIADSMEDKPTEFELITAIAFLYFKESKCDVVVLEAGMGGRLDSTNVIKSPILSVIVGIALDHTAFLGDTVEKIAAEKAGIIKQGVPVLFGGEDNVAAKVIEDKASEHNSPYTRTRHGEINVKSATLSGTAMSYPDFPEVKINLLGLYQPKNCANVLEAIRILRGTGMNIPDPAVRAGLSDAVWHARFEIIDTDPLMIFDGAHNPEGIENAVRSILHYFEGRKVYAITGVLRDKDYRIIARTLSQAVSRAYTITPDNPRALSAEEYKNELSACGVDAVATDGIKTALSLARSKAKEDGTPLVCLGSLYTYVEIINAMKGIK